MVAMQWQDRGIILDKQPFGESSLRVTLLTECHGVRSGLVRVGRKEQAGGTLQPGNLMQAEWKARLAEHLGQMKLELMTSFAAEAMATPVKLAALQSACALAAYLLNAHEPEPRMFRLFIELMETLRRHELECLERYVRFEMAMLTEGGFGLDLTSCAATGRREELLYVSPKSGRAVSREAGAPYHEKLLALPSFLISNAPVTLEAMVEGLTLTGYFLQARLYAPHGKALPAVRLRLAERIRRREAA